MRYYIAENGKPNGPFEPNELMQHGLTVNSMVWCDGMADWTLASQVPELMALLSNQTITNPGGFGTGVPNSNMPFPPVGGAQPTQQIPQQPQQVPQGMPTNQPPVTNQPWNQPQYQPQPQSQPQYGPTTQQTMPKNWLVESIIVTIISLCCCCNIVAAITGIVAIIKAKGVNAKFQGGDVVGANNDAASAKKWIIISVVIFVVWGIVQLYRIITNPELLQQIQEGAYGSALFNI